MSSLLVARLPQLLNVHNPEIVISMMGINDGRGVWFVDKGLTHSDSFLSNLRITKLFKLITNLNDLPDAVSENRKKLDASPLSLNPQNLIKRIMTASPEINAEIDSFLKDKSIEDQIRLYAFITKSIWSDVFESKYPNIAKYDKARTKELLLIAQSYARQALIKSISLNDIDLIEWLSDGFSNRATNELGLVEDCRLIADGYIKTKKVIPDSTSSILLKCLHEDQKRVEALNSHFNLGGLEFLEGDPIQKNYNLLHEILKKKNIHLIAMQYPRRPIEHLKNYFLNTDNTTFVENSANFEMALKSHTFDQLFVDRFAGDFGHATRFGNQLIAENVANAVINILKLKEKTKSD